MWSHPKRRRIVAEDEKKVGSGLEAGNPNEVKPQAAPVIEGEQQPNVRIPLTFGRWFMALIVASLLGFVPIALWLAALAYLVWTDGPKDDHMANMYEMFQRLYPLMGFFVFLAIGFGWRVAAGRARGRCTMFSSAIMGTLLVLLCNFAHFYVMDYKYYPYIDRARTYIDNVDSDKLAEMLKVSRKEFSKGKDSYNQWVREHNKWVRSGTTDRKIEIPKGISTEDLKAATTMDAYKKWYEEDYNKWVDLKNSLIPDYNKWAQTADAPLWTPGKKHELMPTTVAGVIEDLPPFVMSYPARLKAHMQVNNKATLIISISWVIWLCGFLFGGLWINRTYVSKEELKLRQNLARAAAMAAKRNAKPGAGARKPLGGTKPVGDAKPEEKPTTDAADEKKDTTQGNDLTNKDTSEGPKSTK